MIRNPWPCLAAVAAVLLLCGCSRRSDLPALDTGKLATQYFADDRQWYVDNIPFFECSDKNIEQVYYYRWKMYKAHIRNVGDNRFVITEFINHVPWDREPYCTINAASMHHIYEGRWLRDNRFMDGYIDYLFQDGGNNRRYSESVADAAYARYLVNGDSSFVISQLDSMKYSYGLWADHWDSSKNLYFIPAMPDATEYTIASIDASGGKDGFDDGEAFRPTINSYMYGNAKAIARIAAMHHDTATSNAYEKKAAHLRNFVEKFLWNDSLKHFTDRFKVSNQYVHYWDFIRGRELAGMSPWYFELAADNPTFAAAWAHIRDTNNLLGAHGLRTNEPSYQYYFKQFVFFEGKRGSQWNGPSWPYQSSQTITAMANLLNDYQQDVVTNTDYLKQLRLFTGQHFLPDGTINLVENYDPNLGGPIVHYYWSNHYNHSSYNNLVISGLCGIRPSAGDTLDIHPLIDSSIQYFFLSDVAYHGHSISVIYDETGTKYHAGKGLTVVVDGKKAAITGVNGRYRVHVGAPLLHKSPRQPNDLALNISRAPFPAPSASVNTIPDSLFQAIDGRIWYFPEISNRWTTLGSSASKDWFALDFGTPRELSGVNLYTVADGKTFFAPDSITIDFHNGGEWLPVVIKQATPAAPSGNTVNRLEFEKITATRIRINLTHAGKAAALSEIECY